MLRRLSTCRAFATGPTIAGRFVREAPRVWQAHAGSNHRLHRVIAERDRLRASRVPAQIADDLGLPLGLEDAKHFHLVTSYARTPRQALKAPRYDRYDGRPYRVTVSSAPDLRGQARIATYGEILDDYRLHPEHKSLGPSGGLCHGETRGLLGRREVDAFRIVYVGKESNRLEEAQSGLLHNEDEAVTHYDDPGHNDFKEYVLPVLKVMTLEQLREASGIGVSALKDIRAGRARPRPRNRAALTAIAASEARARLEAAGEEVPRDDLSALHA
jgi:hypothetical protein